MDLYFKTCSHHNILLKHYVCTQETLTLNYTNIVGVNKLNLEIYDHVLDRIMLIYNSLVCSSINEHNNLYFVIGNIYVYLGIDRNLHNMCEPDQEFLDGLCKFSN